MQASIGSHELGLRHIESQFSAICASSFTSSSSSSGDPGRHHHHHRTTSLARPSHFTDHVIACGGHVSRNGCLDNERHDRARAARAKEKAARQHAATVVAARSEGQKIAHLEARLRRTLLRRARHASREIAAQRVQAWWRERLSRLKGGRQVSHTHRTPCRATCRCVKTTLVHRLQ
jgi:hypothetical protein